MQIKKLSEMEKNKWEKIKVEKMNKEFIRLKSKYEQELQALKLKMAQTYNELKKKRAIDLDILIQRYKNKIREMEIKYKNDLVDYNRNKNCSRVLNWTLQGTMAHTSKYFIYL